VIFPVTRKSAILAIRSSDSADREWAINRIADAYWKPIYKYIRLKWNTVDQDAEDLTQAFFAAACERSFFTGYDPARALFRTYLRICIDRFVLNERKFTSRLKRGGDSEHVPIEFDVVDEHDYFERECLRSVFNIATETLQRECQTLGK